MCALVTGVQTCALPISSSHGLGACITDGPFRRGKKIWRRYRGSCWKGNCEPQPIPDTGETPLASQRTGQARSKAVERDPLFCINLASPAYAIGRSSCRERVSQEV